MWNRVETLKRKGRKRFTPPLYVFLFSPPPISSPLSLLLSLPLSLPFQFTQLIRRSIVDLISHQQWPDALRPHLSSISKGGPVGASADWVRLLSTSFGDDVPHGRIQLLGITLFDYMMHPVTSRSPGRVSSLAMLVEAYRHQMVPWSWKSSFRLCDNDRSKKRVFNITAESEGISPRAFISLEGVDLNVFKHRGRKRRRIYDSAATCQEGQRLICFLPTD